MVKQVSVRFASVPLTRHPKLLSDSRKWEAVVGDKSPLRSLGVLSVNTCLGQRWSELSRTLTNRCPALLPSACVLCSVRDTLLRNEISLLTIIFCLSLPVYGQQTVEPATGTGTGATLGLVATSPGYPNTTEGLQSLMNDMLAATRRGDRQRVDALVKQTEFADYAGYFVRTYSPDPLAGEDWNITYRRWLSNNEDQLRELLETLAKDEAGTIRVRKASDDPAKGRGFEWEIVHYARIPIDVYCVTLVFSHSPDGPSELIGYFVYADGFGRTVLFHLPNPEVTSRSLAHWTEARRKQRDQRNIQTLQMGYRSSLATCGQPQKAGTRQKSIRWSSRPKSPSSETGFVVCMSQEADLAGRLLMGMTWPRVSSHSRRRGRSWRKVREKFRFGSWWINREVTGIWNGAWFTIPERPWIFIMLAGDQVQHHRMSGVVTSSI